MNLLSAMKRRMRVKLIFNASAGASRAAPVEIEDVIREMQAWKLVPEAYLVEPGGSDLADDPVCHRAGDTHVRCLRR